MARIQWPLRRSRPIVEVVLTLVLGGQQVVRSLVADTGASNALAGFELLLDEQACLLCGGNPHPSVSVRRANSGVHPIYLIRVQLWALGFDEVVPAVGVSGLPAGYDGIAGFRFLNRFNYGNF